VLKVFGNTCGISVEPAGIDGKRPLYASIDKTALRLQSGLFKNFPGGCVCSGLACFQRTGHRLPESEGLNALEQQDIQVIRVDDDQDGFRSPGSVDVLLRSRYANADAGFLELLC